MNKRIPLSEPFFQVVKKAYVNKCIETGWVSTAGKLIEKFENKFKQLVSSKYAVACNSGTSALHLALKSLEIKK